MVYYCAVPLCNNSSYTPGISFHRFPAFDMKRKAWIIRMRRDENRNPKINKYSRVCSAHFLESDFKDIKSGRRELKDGVEPTIFPFPSIESKQPLCVVHPSMENKKSCIKWYPRKRRENSRNNGKIRSEILKKALEEVALINNATVCTINVGKLTAAVVCPAGKENIPKDISVPPKPTKVVLKFVPDVSSDTKLSYFPVFYVLPHDAEESQFF